MEFEIYFVSRTRKETFGKQNKFLEEIGEDESGHRPTNSKEIGEYDKGTINRINIAV